MGIFFYRERQVRFRGATSIYSSLVNKYVCLQLVGGLCAERVDRIASRYVTQYFPRGYQLRTVYRVYQ